MSWSHHYVMRGQHFERVFEYRTRQMWTVAVEGNDASLMILLSAKVRKHRSEARSKTFTFLRNDVHSLFANCGLPIAPARLRPRLGT